MVITGGWFGDPWPSGVCYDDDWRLREEQQRPFPVGEACLYCEEPFETGDSGQALPFLAGDGPPRIVYVHKECQFREVAGPLAHLEKRCPCYGGPSNETPGMTARQEAMEVWRRWTTRQ